MCTQTDHGDSLEILAAKGARTDQEELLSMGILLPLATENGNLVIVAAADGSSVCRNLRKRKKDKNQAKRGQGGMTTGVDT